MKSTEKLCPDDEKIGQMGFQRRPNHQIGAVGWPQSEISSVGGGGRLRLAPIRMPSGECRLKPDEPDPPLDQAVDCSNLYDHGQSGSLFVSPVPPSIGSL